MAGPTVKEILVKWGIDTSSWKSAIQQLGKLLDDQNKKSAQANKDAQKAFEAQVSSAEDLLAIAKKNTVEQQKQTTGVTSLLKQYELIVDANWDQVAVEKAITLELQKQINLRKISGYDAEKLSRSSTTGITGRAAKTHLDQQGVIANSIKTVIVGLQAEVTKFLSLEKLVTKELQKQQGIVNSIHYKATPATGARITRVIPIPKQVLPATESAKALASLNILKATGHLSDEREKELRKEIVASLDKEIKAKKISSASTAQEVRQVEALVRLRATQAALSKGEKVGLGKSLEEFGAGAISRMMGTLGFAVFSAEGLGRIIESVTEKFKEFIKEVGPLQQVREQFEKLATGAGLEPGKFIEELRSATHGLVADTELYRNANVFLQSGIHATQEDVVKLTQATVGLARAQGKDAKEAVEALNQYFLTGYARTLSRVVGIQSQQIGSLRNMRGEMTGTMATTQQFAQLQKVILANYQAIGEPAQTYTEALTKLKVAQNRVMEEFVIGIENSPGFKHFVEKLDELAEKMGAWAEKAAEWGAKIGDVFGVFSEAVGSIFDSLLTSAGLVLEAISSILGAIGQLVIAFGMLHGDMDKAVGDDIISRLTTLKGILKTFAQTAVLAATAVNGLAGALKFLTSTKRADIAWKEFMGDMDELQEKMTRSLYGIENASRPGKQEFKIKFAAPSTVVTAQQEEEAAKKIAKIKEDIAIQSSKILLEQTKIRIQAETQMVQTQYEIGEMTIKNFLNKKSDLEHQSLQATLLNLKQEHEARSAFLQVETREQAMLADAQIKAAHAQAAAQRLSLDVQQRVELPAKIAEAVKAGTMSPAEAKKNLEDINKQAEVYRGLVDQSEKAQVQVASAVQAEINAKKKLENQKYYSEEEKAVKESEQKQFDLIKQGMEDQLAARNKISTALLGIEKERVAQARSILEDEFKLEEVSATDYMEARVKLIEREYDAEVKGAELLAFESGKQSEATQQELDDKRLQAATAREKAYTELTTHEWEIRTKAAEDSFDRVRKLFEGQQAYGAAIEKLEPFAGRDEQVSALQSLIQAETLRLDLEKKTLANMHEINDDWFTQYGRVLATQQQLVKYNEELQKARDTSSAVSDTFGRLSRAFAELPTNRYKGIVSGFESVSKTFSAISEENKRRADLVTAKQLKAAGMPATPEGRIFLNLQKVADSASKDVTGLATGAQKAGAVIDEWKDKLISSEVTYTEQIKNTEQALKDLTEEIKKTEDAFRDKATVPATKAGPESAVPIAKATATVKRGPYGPPASAAEPVVIAPKVGPPAPAADNIPYPPPPATPVAAKSVNWWDVLSKLSILPLPKYQEGGPVTETGPAIVHKGEHVLTKEEAPWWKKILAGKDVAASTIKKADVAVSESVLKPFTRGLGYMSEDLREAAETGHTQTGGVLNPVTRAMVEGVGQALRLVPIRETTGETASMVISPPVLKPALQMLKVERKPIIAEALVSAQQLVQRTGTSPIPGKVLDYPLHPRKDGTAHREKSQGLVNVVLQAAFPDLYNREVFRQLPQFLEGGLVKDTGPAVVHEGEYVLTKKETEVYEHLKKDLDLHKPGAKGKLDRFEKTHPLVSHQAALIAHYLGKAPGEKWNVPGHPGSQNIIKLIHPFEAQKHTQHPVTILSKAVELQKHIVSIIRGIAHHKAEPFPAKKHERKIFGRPGHEDAAQAWLSGASGQKWLEDEDSKKKSLLPQFLTGGPVEKTGPGFLHAGEFVLNADITSFVGALRNLMNTLQNSLTTFSQHLTQLGNVIGSVVNKATGVGTPATAPASAPATAAGKILSTPTNVLSGLPTPTSPTGTVTASDVGHAEIGSASLAGPEKAETVTPQLQSLATVLATIGPAGIKAADALNKVADAGTQTSATIGGKGVFGTGGFLGKDGLLGAFDSLKKGTGDASEKLDNFGKGVATTIQSVGGIASAAQGQGGPFAAGMQGAASGFQLGMMTGNPLIGVAGAGIGLVTGVFAGKARKAAEKLAKDIVAQFNAALQNLNSGTQTLSATIQLEIQNIQEAVTRLSGKKGGRDQLKNILPGMESQLAQLQQQQQQIIKTFDEQLNTLNAPQAYQEQLTSIDAIIQKYQQYIQAGGNVANANEYLRQSYANLVQNGLNTLNQDEQDAINNALQYNDLLLQRQNLIADTNQQIQDIMSQGVAVRQMPQGVTKARQIQELMRNNQEQMDQLNQQISVSKYKLDTEQQIYNLAVTRIGLESQLTVLMNEQTDLQTKQVVALGNVVGGLQNQLPTSTQAALQEFGLGAAFVAPQTEPGLVPVPPVKTGIQDIDLQNQLEYTQALAAYQLQANYPIGYISPTGPIPTTSPIPSTVGTPTNLAPSTPTYLSGTGLYGTAAAGASSALNLAQNAANAVQQLNQQWNTTLTTATTGLTGPPVLPGAPPVPGLTVNGQQVATVSTSAGPALLVSLGGVETPVITQTGPGTIQQTGIVGTAQQVGAATTTLLGSLAGFKLPQGLPINTTASGPVLTAPSPVTPTSPIRFPVEMTSTALPVAGRPTSPISFPTASVQPATQPIQLSPGSLFSFANPALAAAQAAPQPAVTQANTQLAPISKPKSVASGSSLTALAPLAGIALGPIGWVLGGLGALFGGAKGANADKSGKEFTDKFNAIVTAFNSGQQTNTQAIANITALQQQAITQLQTQQKGGAVESQIMPAMQAAVNQLAGGSLPASPNSAAFLQLLNSMKGGDVAQKTLFGGPQTSLTQAQMQMIITDFAGKHQPDYIHKDIPALTAAMNAGGVTAAGAAGTSPVGECNCPPPPPSPIVSLLKNVSGVVDGFTTIVKGTSTRTAVLPRIDIGQQALNTQSDLLNNHVTAALQRVSAEGQISQLSDSRVTSETMLVNLKMQEIRADMIRVQAHNDLLTRSQSMGSGTGTSMEDLLQQTYETRGRQGFGRFYGETSNPA